MKKLCLLLLMLVLLCGCTARETFETLGDEYLQPASAQMKQITLRLPDDAAAQTLRGEEGILYLCDGYEVTVQTLQAGNLSGTLRLLTGFDKNALTVMQSNAGELSKHECVWTAAGEGGDVICRAMILDDGAWHYCVTVSARSEDAPQLLTVWQDLMDSVELE